MCVSAEVSASRIVLGHVAADAIPLRMVTIAPSRTNPSKTMPNTRASEKQRLTQRLGAEFGYIIINCRARNHWSKAQVFMS